MIVTRVGAGPRTTRDHLRARLVSCMLHTGAVWLLHQTLKREVATLTRVRHVCIAGVVGSAALCSASRTTRLCGRFLLWPRAPYRGCVRRVVNPRRRGRLFGERQPPVWQRVCTFTAAACCCGVLAWELSSCSVRVAGATRCPRMKSSRKDPGSAGFAARRQRSWIAGMTTWYRLGCT